MNREELIREIRKYRCADLSDAMDANVCCTTRTFTHAYGRVTFGGTNIPVNCAGVLVKPGDIVCADDDGVLVIPFERAEDVIQFARMQLEDDIKTRGDHYEKLGFAQDDTLRRLD